VDASVYLRVHPGRVEQVVVGLENVGGVRADPDAGTGPRLLRARSSLARFGAQLADTIAGVEEARP
jgi:hypothetical protein